MTALPPIVSIIGRKNSGKTTLLVALAAELRRRGVRVASMKHGHHAFEIDHPGRDSWRHFHEGEVEAVVMASSDRIALVMRTDEGDRDPRALLERLYGGRGYQLILVEGLKRGPFPKVEVFRSGVHERPLYDAAEADPAGPHVAMVTDAPGGVEVPVPVLPLDPAGAHVARLADLLLERFLGAPAPGGGAETGGGGGA